MSILRALKRLVGKLSPKQRKWAMAADQMWEAVSRGLKFEVPAALTTDDDTMQALALLVQAHPEVDIAMHQTKGIVVGLLKDKTTQVAQQTWSVLDQHGYMAKKQGVEDLLHGHERFMRANHLDPAEMVKQAQAAQQAKERIETSQEKMEQAATLPVEEKVEDALDPEPSGDAPTPEATP